MGAGKNGVGDNLTCPYASLFRVAKSFPVTWPEQRCFPPIHLGHTKLTHFTYLEWNVESVFHFKPVGLVFFSITKICHTET